MNKLFTKIATAIAGFAMVVGVGVGIASNKAAGVYAATTAASFSRSGTTDTVTGGSLTTQAEGKSGFYQDGSGTNRYVQIKSNNAYWTTTPTSISVTAKIGGGTGNTDLSNPVYASLLDSSGNVIDSTTTVITNRITTNTGDTYSNIAIPLVNAAYGIRVSHVKESGYNVRYYSFSLSYVASGSSGASSSSSSSSSSVAPVTYSVTYNSNGATSGSAPTDETAYTSGASVTASDNTGTLARTGYIWSGWTTNANGTGTFYSAGSTFSITGNIILYARWIKDYSSNSNVVISADYLNLNSTISNESTLIAVDGMRYKTAPGGSNSVKNTGTSGNKAFDGSSDAILMGKSGAYLYNNDEFQKSIGRIEIFNNGGQASTNVRIAVKFSASDPCSSEYTDGDKQLNNNNAIYTFNPTILNAKFFRVQVTNAYNAQIQIRVVFRIATTSITVSPKPITLAPNTSQQLSATRLPNDTTDVISYSSNNEEVATVSSSGLVEAVANGTATITVTSGTCSDTCAVTVETPTNPYVELINNSVSGYSGQNDSISFTYGNFDSISIVSSDEDVATVEEPVLNAQAGTGTVRVNFVAGGNTTILFKNGSNTLASATVSVTQVTLTLNTNSISIMQGGTETLVATHNADEIDDVYWESDNDKIEVSQFGVIEVADDATVGSTATITVTSWVDLNVYAECVVTVTEHPLADYLTASSIPSVAIGSNTTTWGTACSFTDFTGAKYDACFMGANTASCIARLNDSTKGYIYTSKIPTGMRLKSVSISVVAAGKTVGVYAQLNAFDGAPNDKNLAVGTITSSNLTYTFANNTHYRAICLRGHDAATDIGEVTITYEPYSFVDQTIESTLTTSTQLAYHYESDGDGGFDYSNISIRFGGLISKDLWNSLNTLETITGFGVMITTYAADFQIKDNLDCVELAENDPDINSYVIDYYMPLSSQLPPEVGDNYVWNLFHRVDYSDTDQVFMAVAYIKCGDEYVFFRQVEYSVETLAADYILNRGCDDTTADGSLYYLAD